MKITKNRLKQLIEQEVKNILEDEYDEYRDDQRVDDPPTAHYGSKYKSPDEAQQAGYSDGVDGLEVASPKDQDYMYGYEIGKEDAPDYERAGVQEGFESITPENMVLALQALEQIAISFSPALAAAIAAGAYSDLKDKLSNSKPDAEDE